MTVVFLLATDLVEIGAHAADDNIHDVVTKCGRRLDLLDEHVRKRYQLSYSTLLDDITCKTCRAVAVEIVKAKGFELP